MKKESLIQEIRLTNKITQNNFARLKACQHADLYSLMEAVSIIVFHPSLSSGKLTKKHYIIQ